MSEKHDTSPKAEHPQKANNTEPEQQFTPEELRKAARVQTILYIVMAIMIALPFVFMWLRRSGFIAFGSGE